jgi:hypothetical protein
MANLAHNDSSFSKLSRYIIIINAETCEQHFLFLRRDSTLYRITNVRK